MKLIKILAENFLLFENVSQAEKIMKDLNLSVDNSDYIDLKNKLLNNNNIGYLGILMSISNEKIKSTNQKKDDIIALTNVLYDSIKNNKNYLNSLPKKINDYKDYDELLNDLSNLKNRSLLNKFSKLMTDKNISQEIFNIKNPREIELIKYYFDEVHNTKFSKLFKNKINKYKNINSILNYLSIIIKFHKENFEYDSWLSKIKTNLEDFEIVYNDPVNQRILVITKSWAALKSIGSPSWCIYSNYDSYIKYTNSNIYNQYVFLDFSTDNLNYSIIGFTMDTSGEVTASHLMDDTKIDDILEYFKKINVLFKFKKINKEYVKIIEEKKDVKERLTTQNSLIEDYFNTPDDYYVEARFHYGNELSNNIARMVDLFFGEDSFISLADSRKYQFRTLDYVYSNGFIELITEKINSTDNKKLISSHLSNYLDFFQSLKYINEKNKIETINVFDNDSFKNIKVDRDIAEELVKVFIRYDDLKIETYNSFTEYFMRVYGDEKIVFNIIRQRKNKKGEDYSNLEFFNLKNVENMKSKILNKIQKQRKEGYVDLTVHEVREGIKVGLKNILIKLYNSLIPYFMEYQVDYESMQIFKELGILKELSDAINYKAKNYGTDSLNTIEYSIYEYANRGKL